MWSQLSYLKQNGLAERWFSNTIFSTCPLTGEMFYSKMGCAVLSCIRFFVMLWTVACQAPLSMGSSRQEYWSGLPCPPPEDLPDSGMEAASLVSCNGMRVLYHQCHLGRPSLRYLISYLKLKKLRKVKTAQSLYIYIYIHKYI